MAKLLLLILALLFGAFVLFGLGTGSWESDEESSAVPAVVPTVPGGPPAEPGWAPYPLPNPEATVIHAVVDSGPVSPEFQTGYEIVILGDGTAITTVTPAGASPAMGDARTADQMTMIRSLGVEGLMELVERLERNGCFALPAAESIPPDQVPIGGPTSLLEISLPGREIAINGAGLQGADTSILVNCQAIVAVAAGVEPED
jgi:hypothetical protein